MRIGSLFSGAAGLDRGVQAVFGGEVVWHCEVDASASKVLAHHYPGVPNLGDIGAVDWSSVPPVDVLCGGFPCQDVSAAGKRAGIKEGTRSGLWAVFADAIDALRPSWVVAENVRGLLNARADRNVEPDEATVGEAEHVLRAIGAVVGDLADLGYVGGFQVVSAASVGAPHRRERVFILAADAAGGGWPAWLPEPSGQVRQPVAGANSPRPGEPVALLPTPVTTDAAGAARHTTTTGVSNPGTTLTDAVRLLPTPTGRDHKGRNQRDDESCLHGAVVLLPTPTGSDAGNVRRGGDRSDELLLGGVAQEMGAALLPTPTTQDAANCAGPAQFRRNTLPLNVEAVLLPTPAAADGQRGQDFARANRDGSGGDDLVTLAVKADRDKQWGRFAPAIAVWEQVTRPAPPPTELNRMGNPRLSARFSEWLMGWPAGWVTDIPSAQDALFGDPAPAIGRSDQLRLCGNGVVPQQAEAALRLLLANVFGVAR